MAVLWTLQNNHGPAAAAGNQGVGVETARQQQHETAAT
jgi:hypothetical protein